MKKMGFKMSRFRKIAITYKLFLKISQNLAIILTNVGQNDEIK